MSTLPTTEATPDDVQRIIGATTDSINESRKSGTLVNTAPAYCGPVSQVVPSRPARFTMTHPNGRKYLDLGTVLWLHPAGVVDDPRGRFIGAVCLNAPDLDLGKVHMGPEPVEHDYGLRCRISSHHGGSEHYWEFSDMAREFFTAVTVNRGDAEDLDRALFRAGAQPGRDDDRLSVIALLAKSRKPDTPYITAGDPFALTEERFLRVS